ncbi:hypothetical protein [Francisella adeliensis]|uniref:Uncharacterized protein n=1 Tax=Francisella adeliensis TaxID=2007306 RepID=A0A2Z4XWT9_9GAMM|nr:hypothetical protein [Francisella adeliensis]AXA33160.1 hypothetical protein CDH04_01425 [Francisella adeliensis]MBK2085948.1 hypothetical protein [Francisella adeliensis]MBK2096888.1 hypothetical protein [Francisella adeliensis]QIW11388.1 hypothetical protein FZC43_01425 [Francisella adeliensis]QIW13263.1 hypothetical protein FZC44_01425 [Francisella adeliensis]
MSCPFKESKGCPMKAGKCYLGVFLTILAISIGLKVITFILNVIPGSDYGNIWFVLLASILVLYASKYHKKGNKGCGTGCDCPCNKNNLDNEAPESNVGK